MSNFTRPLICNSIICDAQQHTILINAKNKGSNSTTQYKKQLSINAHVYGEFIVTEQNKQMEQMEIMQTLSWVEVVCHGILFCKRVN